MRLTVSEAWAAGLGKWVAREKMYVRDAAAQAVLVIVVGRQIAPSLSQGFEQAVLRSEVSQQSVAQVVDLIVLCVFYEIGVQARFVY